VLDTDVPGLVLDLLTVRDTAEYYALLVRNREHLGRFGNYSDERRATPEWVLRTLSEEPEDGTLRFGIRWDGRLAGRIDLVAVDPPRYSLGYWIDRDATGRGLVTAAGRAVVAHARDVLGASELFAGVTHGNRASAAVLERLGFGAVADFDWYTRFRLPLAWAVCEPV
jgi:ribosomal-protein-serine acetyltransferase